MKFGTVFRIPVIIRNFVTQELYRIQCSSSNFFILITIDLNQTQRVGLTRSTQSSESIPTLSNRLHDEMLKDEVQEDGVLTVELQLIDAAIYRESGEGTWSQLVVEDMTLDYIQAPYDATSVLKRELLAHISSAQLNQQERNRQRSMAKLIVGLPSVKLLMNENVAFGKRRVITITVHILRMIIMTSNTIQISMM